MITGEIIGARGVQGLGGELPGHAHYGIQGPPGPQGEPFTYEDFTEEQLAKLVGPVGPQGPVGETGPQGEPFTYEDFTEEQLAKLVGPQGPVGATGPQGESGYSPVRGTDYWTEEDVSQMEKHVEETVAGTYGKGTSIPRASDLDTYRTIGKYYASSNAITQSLSNCPTTQNFLMYVYTRTDDGVPSQIIIDLAGKLYIRSSSTTGWRSWVTYITTKDLTAAVETALQEAKDSGDFQGEQGPQGEDYVLTDTDKQEIAEMAAGLVEVPDSGGNVAYDEAQELTPEQKAQARENIGAQPAGNYLTEVPEGYAKTEDVPTDEEIIQLIKDNAPEPVGGIDLGVTGATVGQTVRISAVDENGVPTAWEPVEFPSGGGEKEWTKETITLTEDVSSIELAIPSAKRLFVVAALFINNADNSLTTGTEPIFIQTNGFITGQLSAFIRAVAGYYHTYEIEKIGSHDYVKRTDSMSNGITRNNAYQLYVNGWREMTNAFDTAETINRLRYTTTTSGILFKVGSVWEVYYQ